VPHTIIEKVRAARRAHPAAAPFALLATAILLFFAPYLLAGKILMLRGLFCFYYPRFMFYREGMSQGVIPLWNPYTGCGEPFLADIESQVLYPLNLLYLLLPVGAGTIIMVMLHLFIAGAGIYSLCRTWNVSRAGALFASLVFSFSTAFVSKIEFLSMFESIAWLPLIIALFAAWEKKRSAVHLAGGTCAIALQIFAGYVEIVWYTALCLALYTFCAGIAARVRLKTWRPLLSSCAALGVIFTLGALLAAAQVLPTWEAMSLSANRGAAVDPELFRSSLHPLSIFSFLIPSIYGIPGWGGKYWAPRINEYWLGAHYVGIIPLLVIGAGIVPYLTRRRQTASAGGPRQTAAVVFLAAAAIVSFVYALGEYTPFFDVVWRLFPPIQRFRWPPKILIVTTLSISCLAGICFDVIGRDRSSEVRPRTNSGMLLRGTAIALALSCAGVALTCVLHEGAFGKYIVERFFNIGSVEKIFLHRIPWETLSNDTLTCAALIVLGTVLVIVYTGKSRFRAAAAGALILLGAIDLAAVNYRLLPGGSAGLLEGKPAFAATLCPPGTPVRFFEPRVKWILVYGERSEELFGMARDFMLAQWPLAARTYNAALQGNFKLKDGYDLETIIESAGTTPEIKKNLLGMMNCANIVSFPNLLYFYAFNTLTPGKNARIEPVLPRAFVAGGVTALNGREDLFKTLAATPVDFLSVALTDADAADDDTFPDMNPGRVTHTVALKEEGLHRIRLDVESLAAGILVVTDTFYPGWTARVDGRDEKIYKVNGAFRGMRVPAGRSTVVMEYRPALFRAGCAVSVVTAAALALWVAATVRRKKTA